MSIKHRISRLLEKLPAPVPPMEFITYIIGKDPEPMPGKNRFITGKSYNESDLKIILEERAKNAKS